MIYYLDKANKLRIPTATEAYVLVRFQRECGEHLFIGTVIECNGYQAIEVPIDSIDFEKKGRWEVDFYEQASAVNEDIESALFIGDDEIWVVQNSPSSLPIPPSNDGGHVIEYEGEALTQRSKLNFIGNVEITDEGDTTQVNVGKVPIITELPVGGIVADANKLYVLPIGDDTITIADSGHDNTGKLIEIPIIKSVGSDDDYTANLANKKGIININGVIETSLYNYTFDQASNSNSTRYHTTVLKMLNGNIISITNETQEDTQPIDYVTPLDEPSNFVWWKFNTGFSGSTNLLWTDVISSLIATSVGEGKPLNTGGEVLYDGVDDGMKNGDAAIINLFGSFPLNAAVHTVVKFDDLGGTNAPLYLTNTGNVDPALILCAANSSGQLLFNFRTDQSPTDAVSATSTETVNNTTYYVVSYVFKTASSLDVAGSFVDVYLNGVLTSIADLDISSITDATPLFNELGLGYRDINGASSFYDSTLRDVLIQSSLTNLQENMDYLTATLP